MFNKEFVHTDRFPEQVARDLESLFESRQTGDYDYHVTFDEAEAKTGLAKLTQIIETVHRYIEANFDILLGPH